MSPPGRQDRPSGNTEAVSKSFGGDSSSIRATGSGAPMPRPEWDIYLRGYCDGYRDGIDLGRRQMDDEIATLQREAHRVVLVMAKLDPQEVSVDRRRRAQVDAAKRHAADAEPWSPEVA